MRTHLQELSSRRCGTFGTGFVFIALMATGLMLGQESESSGEEAKSPLPANDFGSYTLILDNNIFDSNREDRARLDAERRRNEMRSIPEERFALVGTLQDADKNLAFFNGTLADYRTVLGINDTIAGYTITEVDNKFITLTKDGETFEFAIGMEMRRKRDEPWELDKNSSGDWRGSASGRLSSGSSRSGSSSSEPEPEPLTGSKADILKKMMERRRQQMNQ